MTSDWKPGDVAMARDQRSFADEFLVVRTGHGSSAYWSAPRDWPSGISPSDCEYRPLIVIDPEDAEQLERLSDLFDTCDHDAGCVTCLTAALREFANPTPRIEEPTGRYTVVEDAKGVEWVRIDPAGFCWQRLGDPSTERNAYTSWDGLDAPVRVLSHGVSPEATS